MECIEYPLEIVKPLLPGYLIKKFDELAVVSDRNRLHEWRYDRTTGEDVGNYAVQEGNSSHNFLGVVFEILGGVALYGGLFFYAHTKNPEDISAWAMYGAVAREFLYFVAQGTICMEKMWERRHLAKTALESTIEPDNIYNIVSVHNDPWA